MAKSAPVATAAKGKVPKGAAKKRNVAVEPEAPAADVDSDEDMHEGEDEAGISQKGLDRLMRALGPEGLDDADVAALKQLVEARGEGEAEEEDQEGDEDGGEDEEEAEDEDAEETEEPVGDEEAEDEEEEEEPAEEAHEDEGDDEEDAEEDLEGEGAEEDEDEDEDAEDAEDASKRGAKHGADAPKDSLAASILRSGLVQPEEDEEDEEEDEEDEDEDDEGEEIPVEDMPEHMDLPEEARALRHNRLRINRTDALSRIYDELRLDGPSASKGSTMPWIETMSVTYGKRIADEVPDAQNDLDRELAFYRQSLDAAVRGRELVLAAKVPFSRPADYFAEMVKTDEHMERVRQRLLDESASIKASEEAKRQRELKKYGKKIQTEKLLDRQKSKRDLEQRVESLKRKRQGGLVGDDEFDVQLEEAIADKPRERRPKPKMSRTSRDQKFGFGGKKRWNKSNTAESTDDFGGARKGKGAARGKARKPQRPGKNKRAKLRG